MKIENASISWLETGLPYSTKFQDVYYSQEDELAESQHVFLNANNLQQRWVDDKDAECFSIAELGFGSGLNFLQVMKLWSESRERPTRLHYLGFEKYPLRKSQLNRVHSRWPSLIKQSAELLTEYIDHGCGCHRLQLEQGITLDLYFGDGFEQLNSRMLGSSRPIQCWFLDGFTPANNPQLWEHRLMQLIAACSDQQTTLSSYSVAGNVRTALKNSGFRVQKLDGFGRKRHMLFADKLQSSGEWNNKESPRNLQKPWFTLPSTGNSEKTAAIIGAGLAGCSTAYSLAQRGWRVTVFDAGNSVASAASGNSQLALRCRLFNAESIEAEFFLHCYLFALRQYSKLKRQRHIPWNDCGVLQLQTAMNKKSLLQQEKIVELYSEQVVNLLSKQAASALSGALLLENAWHFPGAGYMQAGSLCEGYLNHRNIELCLGASISELHRIQQIWSLQAGKSEVGNASVVIIANSHGAALIDQSKSLPLQVLRGQTTEISANTSSAGLKTVISGTRTVFPALDGRHLISASYAHSSNLESIAAENIENLQLAAANFNQDDFLNKTAIGDRVSLRCNSPDRIPIVGMMPDLKKMEATYADLSRNAKATFTTSGHYLPGLYVNVAHGSNGLASCPLSAELIASMINNENLPLSRAAINSLNPSRFLIRDLQKQKKTAVSND